ncbi:Dicarboxylic amino acid permease [Trichoderma lentiforme]|uniref:Dicarboxylic amino acid permease n=1 Tax=Trichoderma lentiforme TaxID=1567552 RepID=A0A9P4XET3_9HYPO|nr:Dicarboxylic amino acid permease [Trichoderma lentiforme]
MDLERNMTDKQSIELTHVQSTHRGEVREVESEAGGGLKKNLESRHITMIALGGALGTGLLIGTGSALVEAGPAGVLIDYSIVGCVVFLVMSALGEMVSYMPLPHGFGGFATRFVDPALGFATGYVYFFKYLLAAPNQLSAFALIFQFWVGDRVSPAVFITVGLVLILVINSVNVRVFGEFEFWLSSLKIIILCGVILLMLILALGGGPTHDRTGFRYWHDPGAFVEYKLHGSAGKFVGVWSALVQAVYAFTGTELVGMTVGEAKHPRLAMPRAVKMTFFRIVFFYVLSVFFLGMVVPSNSTELVFATKSSASAAASPFVVAIRLAKIHGLDHVINGCLIVFVFSASTSDLYIATRTLHAIAVDNKAPQIFKRTSNQGVPFYALGFCALFCTLGYLSVGDGSKVVFGYLTNVVTVFALLTWISILVTHIYFRRACKVQQIPRDRIPYMAPLGIYGSFAALCFLVILTLTKGFQVFIGGFDYKSFIVQYIGIPVYLICIFGYKLVYKTKRVRSSLADLVTGVPTETLAEERSRVEAEKAQLQAGGKGSKVSILYSKVLSWLF